MLTGHGYDDLNRLTDLGETEGTTTLFTQHYDLNPDGTRAAASEAQRQPDGSTITGTTSYVYNDAGQRVQEAVISDGTTTTTFYLTDEHNPTGYAQPIEEWTATSGTLASASLNRTYVLGDHVFAQADGSGQLSYLLTDGHGSTRLLTDATSVVLAAAGLIVRFATTRVGGERRP